MNISKAAEITGLTAYTLRYYEKVGIIPAAPRDANDVRDYDETTIEWINFMKCMREAGIPVEVLVKYYELYKQGESTHEERKQLLINQRNVLQERVATMTETLAKLTWKIDNYDKIMKSENKIAKGKAKT